MSVPVPFTVMLVVDVFCTLQAATVVEVSVQLQPYDEEEVHGVMDPTEAEPEVSVTAPQTIRGDACALLVHRVVVPQALIFWGTAVTARLESVELPSGANFSKLPEAPVPSLSCSFVPPDPWEPVTVWAMTGFPRMSSSGTSILFPDR